MQHVLNSCKGVARGGGGGGQTSHLPNLAFTDPAPFFLAFTLKPSLTAKYYALLGSLHVYPPIPTLVELLPLVFSSLVSCNLLFSQVPTLFTSPHCKLQVGKKHILNNSVKHEEGYF